MAAWTPSERWICFRFQMLKPIKAAAGSTIASSSVRSVLVRSVNRHFFDILKPRQIFLALTRKDYKDTFGRVVKPPQMIVKNCEKRISLFFFNHLASAPGRVLLRTG